MSEFLFGTPELTEANRGRTQALLESLRSVPALTPRYVGVDTIDSLADLATVPVMVKDDLQVALAHLQPRAERGATWVFQSGGSTGSPQLGYAPTGLYMAEVFDAVEGADPGRRLRQRLERREDVGRALPGE